MEEQLYLTGWKGKGELQIMERASEYVLTEKRKNKETGEIYEDVHKIPRKNVDALLLIIETRCSFDMRYTYRFLVKYIMEHYKLDIDTEAFNGGRNRAKYYFPYLYYPLKVLEAKRLIQYFGKGGIQRIPQI